MIIAHGGLTAEQVKEIESVENLYLKSLEQKNYIDNSRYDSLFHNTLVKFSANGRLTEMIKNITIQSERLRWLSILTPVRLEQAQKEHSEIIAYLKEGNREKVCEKITNHLELTIENYNKITREDSFESIICSFKEAFK